MKTRRIESKKQKNLGSEKLYEDKKKRVKEAKKLKKEEIKDE